MEAPDFQITRISANSDTLVQEVRKIGQPPSSIYGRKVMYDHGAGRPVTSPIAFKHIPMFDNGTAALPLTIEAQIGRPLPKGVYFLKGTGTDENFVISSTDFEADVEENGSIRVPTTSQMAQQPTLCMFRGSKMPWHVPFKSANVPANPSDIPGLDEGSCGQTWTWQLCRRIGNDADVVYGECSVSLEMYFFTGPPGFRMHDQIKPECHVLDLIRMLIPSSEEINSMADISSLDMKMKLAARTRRVLEDFFIENSCVETDPGDPVYLQQQPDQDTWTFRLGEMLSRSTRFGSGYDFGALVHLGFQAFGKQSDILTGNEVEFFEMDVAASQDALPMLLFGPRARHLTNDYPYWGMLEAVGATINDEVPVQGRPTSYTSYCFTSLKLSNDQKPIVEIFSMKGQDRPDVQPDLEMGTVNGHTHANNAASGPFSPSLTQVLGQPLVDIMLPNESQSTT